MPVQSERAAPDKRITCWTAPAISTRNGSQTRGPPSLDDLGAFVSERHSRILFVGRTHAAEFIQRFSKQVELKTVRIDIGRAHPGVGDCALA